MQKTGLTEEDRNQLLWEEAEVWASRSHCLDVHLDVGTLSVSARRSPRAHGPTLGSGCSHRRPGHLSFCPLTMTQRGKEEYQGISHTAEGGACSRAHGSRVCCWFCEGGSESQTSDIMDGLWCFSRHEGRKNWAHKHPRLRMSTYRRPTFPASQSTEGLTPGLHPGLCSAGAPGRQLQGLMVYSVQRLMAKASIDSIYSQPPVCASRQK